MNAPALTPIIDFLRQHAPFDQMADSHLDYLAMRLRLVFYAKGSIVTSPQDGQANTLYIIKQGRIRGETEEGERKNGWELIPGECFPVGALLAHRPMRTVARAVEDTFCYELDRAEFDTLLQKSPVFHDFSTRRLASLLDNALRDSQARSASYIAEDSSLNTSLRQLIKRPAITCLPDTPLTAALRTMQAEHVGSMIVTDKTEHVVGIFTLHDLLDRIALDSIDLEKPISEVMTADPVNLPGEAMAHEAALLMARHGIGHICVVERGKLLGMVSERDIFSLQRVGIATLGHAVTRATSVEQLAPLGADIHRLVEQMLAQGASVEQLTRLITTLNDNLTRRVITLILEQESSPPPEFVWLAFGSEGRGEQTLKTDQDNGILFLCEPGHEDEIRAQLLPLAKRINDALAECGFPLCPGNIMASNPECCLSLSEWEDRFLRWIDQGTPEHLLKASIFFDFRALYGDGSALEPLRRTLLEKTAQNSRFRRQMAANTMHLRPPLGLFGEFKLSSNSGENAHSLDLKIQGITPFVDAARIIALTHRITETNTEERLQAAAEQNALRQEDVAAWREAYHFIQLLRMRAHQRQAREGRKLSNHLDPDTLNELDRRILKEAFRQGRKLHHKLELEYQL